MKIAVSSDGYYPILDSLFEELKKRGHEVHYFGPRNEKDQAIDWPEVTTEAVEEVRNRRCDEAIILCWTGTGCSIVANKLGGIRAALCFDGETAKGAKKYNHANVLSLSLRLLSVGLLKEILDAWFETPYGNDDWNALQVKRVKEIEAKEKKNRNSEMDQLVDIRAFIPQIQVELKYATADNFTGEIVYNFQQCLLLKETVLRLHAVQAELETMGLGLKIWDGFRPMAAQWKFWELVPDERYVADPRKGGRHTRGTTVDLTLVTKEGKELPMPSAFDDFSEKAHQDYMGANSKEITNRELLRAVMEKHGFEGASTEWWHFDLIGWENYPPLDISFH